MPTPDPTLTPDAPEPPLSDALARGVRWRAVMLLIAMALLLVGSALYLMWARGAFEQTQPLYLSTDDSDGVLVGMDMTFAGFPIGRVRRIELVGSGTVRIQVDVPVRDAHWLRSSSVFTLERGLVGAARLRAFTGVPDDPPLAAGAARVVLRGDVAAEIPKMMSDVRDVLQNVARLTASDGALGQTLGELQAFSARLNTGQGGLVAALTGNAADARRVGELLARSNQLLQRVDALVARADRQVLGKDGLLADSHEAVRQLGGLLQEARQSVQKVDAVLKDVQAVASNARGATDGLGDLRADVESSLRKIDALIAELNRKWPFAPRQQELSLP